MNNTIENAREFYENNMRNIIYKVHNLRIDNHPESMNNSVYLTLQDKATYQLMVDYHKAIIQSKIEILGKEIELIKNVPYKNLESFEKNNKAMWILKDINNYLKEMLNETNI